VRASASAGSIELSWESNDEPDLASYRIYRSVDGGGFERIGEVSLPAYSDKGVQVGHTYRYQVTAVDQSGNESGRSAVVEAGLR
jgi:fibronectin type 3 domain-containing protein